MQKKVNKLHELRGKLAVVKGRLDDSRAGWEMENAELLNGKEEIEREIEKVDEELRKERVELWDGQDKGKHYGLGIQERVDLEYKEEDALAWAIDHELFLRLNKGPFEKYAKEGGLEFVMIKKRVIATIAKDLTPYLGEDND